MTDWRDDASEEVQDDFDRLAEVTLAAARSFLDLEGQFLPFPMAIKTDGVLAPIGLDQPNPPSSPDIEAVMAGLVGLFRERRGSIRALALAADVLIPDEMMDAIEVRLEHQSGLALKILVPYTIDSLDDSYLYEEP
ncbi:MAG TPA: hypothetical protein VGF80_02020, partial [Galbitalea sp.]